MCPVSQKERLSGKKKKKRLKIAYVKIKSELSFYPPQRIGSDREKMATF